MSELNTQQLKEAFEQVQREAYAKGRLEGQEDLLSEMSSKDGDCVIGYSEGQMWWQAGDLEGEGVPSFMDYILERQGETE